MAAAAREQTAVPVCLQAPQLACSPPQPEGRPVAPLARHPPSSTTIWVAPRWERAHHRRAHKIVVSGPPARQSRGAEDGDRLHTAAAGTAGAAVVGVVVVAAGFAATAAIAAAAGVVGVVVGDGSGGGGGGVVVLAVIAAVLRSHGDVPWLFEVMRK